MVLEVAISISLPRRISGFGWRGAARTVRWRGRWTHEGERSRFLVTRKGSGSRGSFRTRVWPCFIHICIYPVTVKISEVSGHGDLSVFRGTAVSLWTSHTSDWITKKNTQFVCHCLDKLDLLLLSLGPLCLCYLLGFATTVLLFRVMKYLASLQLFISE